MHILQIISLLHREYYQKPHDKLKLSGEGFSFEEANNRTIAFYDTDTSLYLRGHIVGKDIDCDSTSIGSKTSKSDKNLPTKLKAECDMLDKKPKSYSVKRRNKSTEEDSASKWIVYAIDIGTYYLVSFDNLYNLDDKFLSAKPFAVACKLNECHLLTFESRFVTNSHYFDINLFLFNFMANKDVNYGT